MREDEEYTPEEYGPEGAEPEEWAEETEAEGAAGAPEDAAYTAPEEPAWQPRSYPRGGTGDVISTNLTINLISTLCALSGLLGLFFYYADKRSQAVRRFAVQSSALFFVYAIGGILCFVLGAVLGAIPIVGGVLRTICHLAWAALTVVDVVARVRMMRYAYAGEAYVLPVIGEQARNFE